jgi:hypothetical protein
VNNSQYERHTAIWSDVGDTGSVGAQRGTQAMYFGFPPSDNRLSV